MAVDFRLEGPSRTLEDISAESGRIQDLTVDNITAGSVSSAAYYAVLSSSITYTAPASTAWQDVVADGGMTWSVGDSNGVTATSTTITVPTAGKWHVSASATVRNAAAPAGVVFFDVGFGINGADPVLPAGKTTKTTVSTAYFGNVAGSYILDMAANDTIEVNIRDFIGNTTDFELDISVVVSYIGS